MLVGFFFTNEESMILSSDWLCFDCRGSRRLEDWWLPHHWSLQKLHHCTLLPSLHICHYWGKTTDIVSALVSQKNSEETYFFLIYDLDLINFEMFIHEKLLFSHIFLKFNVWVLVVMIIFEVFFCHCKILNKKGYSKVIGIEIKTNRVNGNTNHTCTWTLKFSLSSFVLIKIKKKKFYWNFCV